MNGLYQIPGIFLVVLCHALVIYNISEHKYSKTKFIFYGCIYGACFVALGSYGYAVSGVVGIFSYMGVVILTFLFSCIISRDCFSKKCFLFITYFCLFSAVDNILKLIIGLILPNLSAPAAYYAAVVLRSAALLLILALYEKYAAVTFHSLTEINGGRWWNLALTALLFYLAQAALSVANAKAVMPPALLILLFIAVSFIMCAVYGVVFSNIGYMKKDAEAALVRQNAEYLSARLSALQSAEEIHRRLRHDMRHHLETIAEYVKAGDTAGVLKYIGQYSVEISEAAVKEYSLNRTVNSILSVYTGKATESGISFEVKCNTRAELAVSDVDLIALLGNLLENALHGCQKSGKEQPEIRIHIRMQKSRLIIVCDNDCSGDLKLTDGLPSGKGIGISSILTVCRKYDGDLDYNIENGVCSACAVLNL